MTTIIMRIMENRERLRKKIEGFMFDHFRVRFCLEQLWLLLISSFSAIVYAFGFSAFITPQAEHFTVITGGMSGVAQNVTLALSLFGITLPTNAFQSILYFALNVPIVIFAFIKIGKKFAIYSVINVGLSSLFIYLFSNHLSAFTTPIAQLVQNNDISRVFFAGICTGLSSGIIFKYNISAGGMDTISYYFGLRKSSSIGKYSVTLNVGVVGLYTILLLFSDFSNWAQSLVALLYSFVYLFTVSLLVDLLSIRNKKVQIQIITENKDMCLILMNNFPHGATISRGYGAFTNKEKEVIYMVISSTELKKITRIVKLIDPKAFVSATALIQVYGNFFIAPVH